MNIFACTFKIPRLSWLYKSVFSLRIVSAPFLHTLASIGIDPNLPEDEINRLLNRPVPFPYQTKYYGLFAEEFDGTLKRWDDNSKLIVVDGNHKAGKTQFARELAKAYGMKLYSEVDLDMYYINYTGFDLRWLNRYLPYNYHCPVGMPKPDFRDIYNMDMTDFWRDPTHLPTNAKLLNRIMILKICQLLDAMQHIYSTGQGCVIDNSFFADFANQQALYDVGWLSDSVRKAFFEIRGNIFDEFERVHYPHLAIYLDVPYQTCLERIRNDKSNPDRANSLAFANTNYLQALENALKSYYITDLEQFCEVIVYDWSKFGIVDWVCDDLSTLQLEFVQYYTGRFKDWQYTSDIDLCRKRRKIHDYRESAYQLIYDAEPYCDDLQSDPNHSQIYHKLMDEAPGCMELHGYDPEINNRPFWDIEPTTTFLAFVNDRLPILRARREAMKAIIDNPENQANIKARAAEIAKNSFDQGVDHF